MYASVKYIDGTTVGTRSYTYKTNLALKLGDHVIAPTQRNQLQEAVVVGVNMPEPSFECKSIVEYAAKENADG